MQKLITCFEKIYHRIFRKRYCRHGYYLQHVLPIKRIIIFLNYPKFIHLGDMLWFEPIIRALSSKYQVLVCAPSNFAFYFQKLGYQLIMKYDILPSDTIMTRSELAYFFRKRTNIIWLDFSYFCLEKKLIDTMVERVSSILTIASVPDYNFAPQQYQATLLLQKQVKAKFTISDTKKYIIFNNYIDSGKFGLGHKKLHIARKQLLNKLIIFKRDNIEFAIIHTGSANDKLTDLENYQNVDLDLRGITTVEEMFVLASLDNVIFYLGFDTVWMHIFNLYNKTSFIKLRPGFSNEYNAQVKQFVAVPFSQSVAKIEYL